MHGRQNSKLDLQDITWEEGKIFRITEGPYRHAVVVHCSSQGRQKTRFANGEHSYFGYVELFDGNGQWIQKGAGVVPVLPDGRFIMVVEQRPAQGRYQNRPMMAWIDGKQVDLSAKYGPYSSLEFPGGAVNAGEGLRAGFLRELAEETDIANQKAVFYSRCYPIYPFGSDLALAQFMGVAFLSGLSYSPHVTNDGGLHVVALTRDEVEWSIHHGVIHSAQAALLQWSFYLEVERVRKDDWFWKILKEAGYMTLDEVQIVKPN